MILHVLQANVCGPHILELVFSDGTTRRVNVSPLLEGEVFVPLHDPAYFARVVVDPLIGTVVWPNEADIAPEALYALPEERVGVVADVSSSAAER